MDFELQGKTAIITGAGGIICGVMAKKLAQQGMKVAVLDIAEAPAEAVAAAFRAGGGHALAVQANVLEKDSLTKARNTVMEHFGRVDVLINGAGGNKKEASTSAELSFFDMPIDALKWVFDLNVMGAVLTTQAFGRDIAAAEGTVINIASMASIIPLTNTIAYSGAKAAVANFTQWMAVHFNQNYSRNIRVNAVAPGFLLTSQNRFLMQREDGSPTERGEKVLAKTPMGRYGSPEEIAQPVLWLCSDAASFVNGAVIPIDGGFSAYWGV